MKYHFAVYEHTLVFQEDMLLKRKFIVLKDNENTIHYFTNFHKYIKSGKNKYARRVADDGNSRHYYVCKLLNYVFFQKYHIQTLNEIKLDMIQEFLNDYGLGLLPEDEGIERTKATVDLCIRTIIDFLELYIEKNKKCLIKKESLYKTVKTRGRKGNIVNKKVPVFDVLYKGSSKTIFRDVLPKKKNEILSILQRT